MKKFTLALLILAASVSTPGLSHAANESETVAGSLKTISEKQDQILQALEELKSELNIVKIRVSSAG